MDERKTLLDCVRYHHGAALKGARLDSGSLAYLVYEADNIAAGTDRREKEEGEGQGFVWSQLLASVFNVFDRGQGEKRFYRLSTLDAKRPDCAFPLPIKDAHSASRSEYAAIMEKIKANFEVVSPLTMSPEELLRILEDTLSFVPSSTNEGEEPDISLYAHVKVTAAVAAALLAYFGEKYEYPDYRKLCLEQGREGRKEMRFLLISGEFSGLQKFIYSVPEKGALRLLRGRSFYLDVALENIADELLSRLSLSRANLIYSGGGHFYILAANTKGTRETLREAARGVNRRLAQLFGAGLYFACGAAPVSAAELMGEEPGESVFARAAQEAAKSKLCRYQDDEELLSELTDEGSELNRLKDGSRECKICRRAASAAELSHYHADRETEDSGEACPVCNAMYDLGRALVDGDTEAFAVLSERADAPFALALPSPFEPCFLTAVPDKELERLSGRGVLRHIYDKNGSRTGELIRTRLWVADYAARDEVGKVLDFKELAEAAGDEVRGIRRLGILRADVDFLGASFIAGFLGRMATLSRLASLSGALSFFFKFYLKALCHGELPKGQEHFSLFGKRAAERKVHVVYAGGDDLFIVGAWDDLLELSVDLRRAFSTFTNDKLSFSAGLGLFSASYPIYHMALDTGALEDEAKEAGKDRVALWGAATETAAEGRPYVPCFKWQELTEDVVGEKLAFLLSHFNLAGINGEDKGRLPCGKSLLYRLLELLSLYGSRFNLARFAYTLARMEPQRREYAAHPELKKCYAEVRDRLFTWGRRVKSREPLVTAINLVIYRMREK